MRRKITSGWLTGVRSVRRPFMVRHMNLLGRRGILGIVLLVAVAAAGVLGSHGFTRTREPLGARCPRDPRVALACHEQRYRSMVAERGVAEAFADLKAGYAADPEMQRLCHAITHAIGQAAVRKYSTVAEAFRYGDNACGSGYYHGVMQGFALTLGREKLLSDLDAVCAGVPGKERKSLDYFNCVHGLGHAIMAVRADELFDALHDCDGLTGSMEQNACVNGVFMENLIVDGEHGGHYSKYLKPDEPLYPCTAVGEQYKAECFDMQTSYALGVVRGDFAKVFALCAGVGASFRSNCYQSLGRDAATVSRDQVPATVATCRLGVDHEQRSYCVLGAVLDFVYYYHSAVQAKALCSGVDPDLREGCRSAIARLVGRFYRSAGVRRATAALLPLAAMMVG